MPTNSNLNLPDAAGLDQIDGFRQIRLLGQGGMGRVYLAEEVALSRQVAIKVLRTPTNTIHPAASQDYQRAVIQEAKTLAQVNHPNVVQIYRVLEQSLPAIVMEFMPGNTLKKYQLENPLDPLQKINLLYQIAQGLDAIHQRGIVHRDIKADNILIDTSTNKVIAKLADFGIASQPLQAATGGQDDKHSKIKGSLSYMSPEQLQHQEVSACSDMFSFGVLAFQMLAGRHPFETSTSTGAADLSNHILNNKAMDARDITPALPEELADLLNQLLRKSPASRPNSKQTSDRLQQVERMVQQQDVLHQPTQTIEHTPLTATRSNTPTMLAVALLVVMSMAVYWMSAQTPKTRYVAILKPIITETAPLSGLQKNLVQTSIEDALQQLIISTPNLMLIPQSEFSEEQMTIAQIGLSTGADDIITTQLTCSEQRCEMVLALQSKTQKDPSTSSKWHTINRQQHPIFLEHYQSIYQFSQTQLTNLYKEITPLNSTSLVISEADYAEYLSLYHMIYSEGQYHQRSLEKLQALINNNLYFYPLYRLYFDTALDVYFSSGQSDIIATAQTIYASVPKELRQTKEHLSNGFYLALGTEQYELASNILDKLENTDLDISEVHLLKASYYQYTQDFKKSISEYNALIKIRPSALAFYHLAYNYYWTGNQTLAIENLEKAKSLNSFSTKVNNFLGGIYLQQGRLPDAILLFRAVTELAPSGDSFSNLAVAQLLNKHYGDAIESIKNALVFNPEHAGWLINYADALYLSGSPNDAKRHYQKILELSEDKVDLVSLMRKAQAQLHLGDLTTSLKNISEAKKLAHTNPNVLYISAMILAKLGENQSALLEVEQAIEYGIGAIWFYLPWFDGLCNTPRFSDLVQITSNSENPRCPQSLPE